MIEKQPVELLECPNSYICYSVSLKKLSANAAKAEKKYINGARLNPKH